METRRLGAPGTSRAWPSSVARPSGAAATPEEVAAGPFEAALAAGVNHLDIAPQYGDAERVVGPLVPAVRDRLFVAGKTMRGATPTACEAQFDDTRRLLGCEVLDLYQAHAVTDARRARRPRRRIDRIVALREQGATRSPASPATTSPPGHLHARRCAAGTSTR